MVVLIPQTLGGETALINAVEEPRTEEQLRQQAEDARNSRVLVDYRTGEIRRASDNVLVGQIKPDPSFGRK